MTSFNPLSPWAVEISFLRTKGFIQNIHFRYIIHCNTGNISSSKVHDDNTGTILQILSYHIKNKNRVIKNVSTSRSHKETP